jgi:hypothetical protein
MNEPQAFVDLQDAGNAQAQLILQAIARHADWDDGSCYPSQTALARMAKCDERTIRRYLRKLEGDGLITCEERRKDNGAQQSNLITLNGYAEWIKALREGGNVSKPRAVKQYDGVDNLSAPPVDNLSGDGGHILSGGGGQQESANKGTSLNDQNNKSAQARENNFVSRSEGKPMASFELTPLDPQWRSWMKFFFDAGNGKAEEAEAAGKIFVTGKWPETGKLLHIPAKGISERSKAMAGDR